jgi:hypothetical protein
MSYPAIPLDTMAATQHVVTFNQAADAMSAAALFGVKKSNGLTLTLYGGKFPTDAGPVSIASTKIALTASATNYIYVDTVGNITKVTAAPTGWPGPMSTGARALYELVVGTDAVTSWTCYRTGPTTKGVQGPQGATGPAGPELWSQRKRIWEVVGGGALMTSDGSPGLQDYANVGGGGAPATTAQASSSLLESVGRCLSNCGTTAANSSGGVRSEQNYWYRGNAAGRGGFDISFRFGIDTTYGAATHFRSFVGLWDVSGGDPSATVDPSALVNLIGVGADDGDQNLSLIHNDGSGTATKTAFGTPGNFPARAVGTNRLYELRLYCDANASAINYSMTDVDAANTETGSISSDIPANTQFLGWIMYENTGTGGANCGLSVIQVAAYARY